MSYPSHQDEIEVLLGRTPYGNAETSKADIVCRIREYAEVYGPAHFAELMLQASRGVAEDRAMMPEGIEPIAMWGRAG